VLRCSVMLGDGSAGPGMAGEAFMMALERAAP
jgi:hypothetical protein